MSPENARASLNLYKSAGSGQPVFFQHGLCGNAAQTIEAFPESPRFRLHTLECRGHGGSKLDDEKSISINTFADDVAQAVEAQNAGALVVGGISMGAAISLHLVVHKPHLVRALVLARPAWITDNAPDNMKPNAMVGKLLTQFPPEEAKSKFMASATAQTLAKTAPDNLASLLSFFQREPISETAALLAKISSDGPSVTEAQVRALRIPTLIMATEQDAIHPMAHAQALHALIPKAHFATLTPKGVDKKAYVTEFRATLLKFLEETA